VSLLLLFKRSVGQPAAAPANLVAPVVTSSWVEGTTASTTTGSWSGLPTSYSYQWQRGSASGTNFGNIATATASSYTLQNADVGFTIRVQVIANNASGSGVSVSAISPVVTAAGSPFIPSPARIPWRFVLADRTGVSIGELHAYDRQASLGVSRVGSASFRILASEPLWAQIAVGQSRLKVYNSIGALIFYGPIISAEETGSGQGMSIQYNAADLMWYLGKRIIGGPTQGGACPTGVMFLNQDSGLIAHSLLSLANADANIGIAVGLRETFLPRTVTYSFNNLLDSINELGAIAGSYEWALRYFDSAVPSVFLDLEAQMGGDVSSAVYFDYGMRKNNCSSYSRVVSQETIANQVYVEGSDATGNRVIVREQDLASQAAQTLYQDYLQFSAITVPDLTLSLAMAHVAARAYPREIVQLTPFPKLSPKMGADWRIGDTVSISIAGGGRVLRSGKARVWGADISLGDEGDETPSLQLVPS
jgi:hypothetical protein